MSDSRAIVPRGTFAVCSTRRMEPGHLQVEHPSWKNQLIVGSIVVAYPSSGGQARTQAASGCQIANMQPARPPGSLSIFDSPMCIKPRKNVPVVTMAAPQSYRTPILVTTPQTLSASTTKSSIIPCFTSEIRLLFYDPFQAELVSLLIALGPWSPNRRALLHVEHPELNTRLIRVNSHLSA